MKASESLQNDQSTATENALRLHVDATPAFIHTARPDGYLQVVGRPSTDEGRRSEFVGAVTDITNHRRAEESLRKSEAYLADAQKLSQTGSWAWSPEVVSSIGPRNATAFRVSIHGMVCPDPKNCSSGFIPMTNPSLKN